jgi:hypothetical protein
MSKHIPVALLLLVNEIKLKLFLLTHCYDMGHAIAWLRHHAATSQKAAGSIFDEVIRFLNLPNPSSHTTALESTQPVTETSIRNLPGGKGRVVHEADSLTTICEPIV